MHAHLTTWCHRFITSFEFLTHDMKMQNPDSKTNEKYIINQRKLCMETLCSYCTCWHGGHTSWNWIDAYENRITTLSVQWMFFLLLVWQVKLIVGKSKALLEIGIFFPKNITTDITEFLQFVQISEENLPQMCCFRQMRTWHKCIRHQHATFDDPFINALYMFNQLSFSIQRSHMRRSIKSIFDNMIFNFIR